MKTVHMKELSLEAFLPYGTYSSLYNSQGIMLGGEPIEFYPDLLQVNLGTHNCASLSTCRICKRPPIIDVTECHFFCEEGLLPFDGDIAIHVAPATSDKQIPLDQVEVFRIPKGTLVCLRPGVWHHAPFTLTGEPVNVLVVLPEKTYANDCHVYELPEQQHLEIKGI